MQYGDHGRQVDISPSPVINPHFQQGFGDRGDAYREFADMPHEITSPKPVFIGHVTEFGIPTLPSGKCSTSLDVELTGKPVQPPQIRESSPAVKSHSTYEAGDADQTLSDITTHSQTTLSTLSTSVMSADKRINWETLFMPYRLTGSDALQTLQPLPITFAKEPGSQSPYNLAAIREGFSETCVMKHYSEGVDIGRDRMDDTSFWVMSCNISV